MAKFQGLKDFKSVGNNVCLIPQLFEHAHSHLSIYDVVFGQQYAECLAFSN
jgi:hypothetical protein